MPKSITNYWWKSCSQCRDTRAAIAEKVDAIADRDFFKDPFSADELRALAGSSPISDLFSMKSPSVKKLGLTPERMSEQELLDWMLKEPRLIRRPLVVVDDVLHIQPRPKDVDGILS